MSAPEPPNRTLVSQAITDIQGSIHANDEKSAAGLIVHGLLATAVVTLASQLGSIYEGASVAAQVVIKLTLGGMLLAAVLSITCLIKAIRPYEPKSIATRLAHASRGVFFPDIRKLTKVATSTGPDELAQLRPGYEAIATPNTLDDEYLTQLLKVADIRANEADWAKRGFLLLGVEIALVAVYLTTVGCIAGNMLGAGVAQAGTTQHTTTLDWVLTQASRRQSISGSGKLALSADGQAHVRLEAHNASGLEAVQLATTATFRCVGARGSQRSAVSRAPTQRTLPSSASGVALETILALARRPCAEVGGEPTTIVIRLAGSARSDSGELRTATLTLARPGGASPRPFASFLTSQPSLSSSSRRGYWTAIGSS